MSDLRGFWQGKRVLLTGHTGFKGSWLSLWLQRAGAELVGVALPPPTQPSLFEIAKVAQGMTSVTADIRDLERMVALVKEHRPQIVLHLAAQSVVRQSYKDPVETFATNVMGTVNVLEAVRRNNGVLAVVVVSSDKCYENREWHWGYRESDPMGGHDPYSNSKGCTELVTASYRSSFFGADGGMAVGSGRAGNVIGGGDWTADQLVPDAIRAFGRGQPVLLRSPGAVRPWQFVLEPLEGYLRLAQALVERGQSVAEGWNFGPSPAHAQPVQWVVECLARHWGPPATWGLDAAQHPHEAGYLKLDSSRANVLLNWQSRLSLSTTLAWTVEWYQAHLKGADMRALTLEQIERFERAMTVPEPL